MNKLLIAFVIIVFTGGATAASFDCSKSTSLVEKEICSSDTLSRLDVSLNKNYQAALAETNQSVGKQDIIASQRRWLAARDACQTSKCIETKYLDRISTLQRAIETEPQGAPTTITHAQLARDEAWQTSALDIRMRRHSATQHHEQKVVESKLRQVAVASMEKARESAGAENEVQSVLQESDPVIGGFSDERLRYVDHMHEWEKGRTLKEIERLRSVGSGSFNREMIFRELARQDAERERVKVLRGIGPSQMIFMLLVVALADPLRWLISIFCAWIVPNHAGAAITSVVVITTFMLAIARSPSLTSLVIGALVSAAITSAFFLLRRKLRNKKLHRQTNESSA